MRSKFLSARALGSIILWLSCFGTGAPAGELLATAQNSVRLRDISLLSHTLLPRKPLRQTRDDTSLASGTAALANHATSRLKGRTLYQYNPTIDGPTTNPYDRNTGRTRRAQNDTKALIITVLWITQVGAAALVVGLQGMKWCCHNDTVVKVLDSMTVVVAIFFIPTTCIFIVTGIYVGVVLSFQGMRACMYKVCGWPQPSPVDLSSVPGPWLREIVINPGTGPEPPEGRGVPQHVIATFPTHNYDPKVQSQEGTKGGEKATEGALAGPMGVYTRAVQGLLGRPAQREVAELGAVGEALPEPWGGKGGDEKGQGDQDGKEQELASQGGDTSRVRARPAAAAVGGKVGQSRPSNVMLRHNCCAICLGEYEGGDLLRSLPCSHAFHKGCIDSWMDSHVTCPVCRMDLCHADDPE